MEATFHPASGGGAPHPGRRRRGISPAARHRSDGPCRVQVQAGSKCSNARRGVVVLSPGERSLLMARLGRSDLVMGAV